MIHLHDISYTYPGSETLAIDRVTLSVQAGIRLAVLGPGGSGKSTLAQLIKGLLEPTSGSISLDGITAGEIGYLGADPYDWIVGLTVEEDIVFGLENRAMSGADMEVRLKEAVERCGLSGMEKRLTHSLSGGEQQKVGIAALFALRCKLFVLDESFSMLDRRARSDVRALVAELCRHEGPAVVEITNNLEEALVADRLLFLDSGRILFDGTPLTFPATTVGREWASICGGAPAVLAQLIDRGVIAPSEPAMADPKSALLRAALTK